MAQAIVGEPSLAPAPRLHVPDVPEGADPIRGALLWAAAGWYVGPIDPKGKHAGSVLGTGWPSKTSRDPQVIADWFAGTDYQPFVHCGRSGAVAFDLDTPDETTEPLRRAILECRPPIHTTRRLDGASRDEAVCAFERFEVRGHVVFLQPPGRTIGNGNGRLGRAWGEVRGRNGIIVVDPARHSKPEGLYRVRRPGVVPALPDHVADLLDDSTSTESVATDAEVGAALARWTGMARPAALQTVLDRWDADVRGGGASRHVTLVDLACWAARDARAGAYPLLTAYEALWARWTEDVARALGSGRVLTPTESRSEFAGVVAWAVAQVMATPELEILEIRARHEAVNELWTSALDLPAEGAWDSLWS